VASSDDLAECSAASTAGCRIVIMFASIDGANACQSVPLD
jgi:hypothetical protein